MTTVNYLPPDANKDLTVELVDSDTLDTAFLKGFKQAYILSLWIYEDETLLERFMRLHPDYFKELDQ